MKRFLACFLAAMLIFCMSFTAFAADIKVESTEEGKNTASKSVTASYTPKEKGEILGIRISGAEKNAQGVYVIKPTDEVTLTVFGTNLQNLTEQNSIVFGYTTYLVNSSWTFSEDGLTATQTFSSTAFANISYASEIVYTNDDGTTYVKTGIQVIYDDGIAEEERAQITELELTVDGKTYKKGDAAAVVTPDTKKITITVKGKNFKNLADRNYVVYAMGPQGVYCSSSVTDWIIDTDANTATSYEMKADDFGGCIPEWELLYFNDGGETELPSGVKIKYESGLKEEESAQITGITSIKVDNVTYTAGQTAVVTPENETVTITVKGTKFEKLTVANKIAYYKDEYYMYTAPIVSDFWIGKWTIDTENNSAVYELPADYFEDCEGEFELKYNNGGDWIDSGIKVKYDNGTTGPAVLNAITVTVDGTTYTSGQTAIITPESKNITIQVSGENFANLTENHQVAYVSGTLSAVSYWEDWNIDTTKKTATLLLSRTVYENTTTAFELFMVNGKSASPKMSGVKVLYVSEQISVGIKWGKMAFTYYDANEANNVTEGWASDNTGGDQVIVSNNGKKKISAAAAYTQAEGYSAITGVFANASADLDTAQTYTFTLNLTGKPDAKMEEVQIGSVKITISEYQESNAE